jgi:hypothetical protein
MNAETFEQIAEHVHIGWMHEKQRQGFASHTIDRCPETLHRGQCSVQEAKHHPDMLSYAELAENVKEYDRVTVRAVLAGIEAAGLKIVPA